MGNKKQIHELVEDPSTLPNLSDADQPLIERFVEQVADKANAFGNGILEGAKLMDLDAPEADCLASEEALCITPVSWGKMGEDVRQHLLENAPEGFETPADGDTFLRVTLNSAPFVDFVQENTTEGYTEEEKLKLMIFMHYNLREHANQVSPYIAMNLQMKAQGISIEAVEASGVTVETSDAGLVNPLPVED